MPTAAKASSSSGIASDQISFDDELIDEPARMWRAMAATCVGSALIVLAPVVRALFSSAKPPLAASNAGLPALVELAAIAIALFCAAQAVIANVRNTKRPLKLALRVGGIGFGILDLLTIVTIAGAAQHDVGSAFGVDLLLTLVGQVMLFTGTAAGSAERLLATPVDAEAKSGFVRVLGYPRRLRPIAAVGVSLLLTVVGFTVTGSDEVDVPRQVIDDYLEATRTGNDRDLLPFFDTAIMLDGVGASGIRLQTVPAGDWRVKSAKRSGWLLGDSATLDVTLVNARFETVSGRYKLKRNTQGDRGWHITNPFAMINLQAPEILKEVNINGTWIPTFSGASAVPYRAAAGTYLIQSGYPQLFTTDTVEVKVLNDRADVSIKPQLKPNAQDLARNWGKYYIDACLAKVQHQGDGAATNCPFEAPGIAELGLPKNTNITGYRWSVDKYPALEMRPETINGKAQYVIAPTEAGTVKCTVLGDGGKSLKSFDVQTSPFVGPLLLTLGTVTVNFVRR